MTANELVDEFKNRESHWKLINYIHWAEQAETMLRQQQAEIKALKLRELTEWEIKECWEEATEMREHFCSQYFDFAHLILKKASEK